MPIVQYDLSQIEWRAAAWLSQDETMMYEINHDVDQHIAACTELMELPFIGKDDPASKQNRFYAKIFNFRMIYGGSHWGFHLDSKMPNFSLKKWEGIVKGFFKKYWQLKMWHDKIIGNVYRDDGWLMIPTGRKFHFKKVMVDGAWGYLDRQIVNYPVQGLAGGDILPMLCLIIRRGMRQRGMKAKMILTVHDSIVFDCSHDEVDLLVNLCAKTAKLLPSYLSNYFKIDWNVKLDGEAEVGDNYGALHEYKLPT